MTNVMMSGSLLWRAAVAVVAVCALSALQSTAGARAKTPVSIELVLAVDTSRSVDEAEFALQMNGIAWAFRTPEIVALIGQRQGVAVTLFQWSSEVDARFIIPWQILQGPASVHDFADRVEQARREPSHRFTAMGRAINAAIAMIENNDLDGQELKIDVSADGRSNTGPVPRNSWAKANTLGIVINGLPILVDTYNLDTYFRERVITGPGAFIETANDYNDFARAFLRKLHRELTPVVSHYNQAPEGPLLADRQAAEP